MNDYGSLLWNIVAAGSRIEHRLEAALEDTGLSLAKLKALKQLVLAGEPLALGQLAERIACVKSNVTQLVDRLENENLVRRIPDPNDRRSVLATVTEEGRRRYEIGAAALSRAEVALADEFPAEHRALIAQLVGEFAAGTPAA